MKKIFIIFISIIALSACADMLNTFPANQIASGNMWTTPALAEKGMNGIYEGFYNRDFSAGTQVRAKGLDGLNKYGIEGLGFCTDYFANNTPMTLLSREAKNASDDQVNHEWEFSYTLIHAANDAIANLHKAGLDEAKYNVFMCEAKFIRAWAYSHLNKLFLTAPIYLEPISNDNCTRTQSSSEELRGVIIQDLTDCINNQYFDVNTINGSRMGRPSKGAAYALRGMTYVWMKEWQKAIDDFDAVAECGYSLFNGRYIDFFTAENEHTPEMIFAIQYDAEAGYSDNIQQALGARDTYDSWGEVKPAADFVDYYQNADGTKFEWSKVPGLEDWNSLTVEQRSVYFLRDGLNSETYESQKTTAVNLCGQETYDKYYLNEGNEARIKQAYANRDPRLLQTILTPYEPVDCYKPGYNGGNNQIGKQLRWPLYKQGTDGGDFWLDKRVSAFYCYKKYVKFLKDEIEQRQRCHTDFPLIRYTDVHLQKAEAYIELNKLNEAKTLIDQVRARAGMGPVALGSQQEMRDAVRYERRVEFPVEAVNYYDEVRWGTYKETKFAGKNIHGGQSWWGKGVANVGDEWFYNDKIWPLPVPKSEYQKNPNLVPTDGWVY